MSRRKTKLYKILKGGRIIESLYEGLYAGITTTKCFGTLDCKSGMRAKEEHRVFFHTWEDAIRTGFRPCKSCKPKKIRCDHMPFGMTGGLALEIGQIKNKKARVGCALCGKKLGTARLLRDGRLKWDDGYIVPHQTVWKTR